MLGSTYERFGIGYVQMINLRERNFYPENVPEDSMTLDRFSCIIRSSDVCEDSLRDDHTPNGSYLYRSSENSLSDWNEVDESDHSYNPRSPLSCFMEDWERAQQNGALGEMLEDPEIDGFLDVINYNCDQLIEDDHIEGNDGLFNVGIDLYEEFITPELENELFDDMWINYTELENI